MPLSRVESVRNKVSQPAAYSNAATMSRMVIRMNAMSSTINSRQALQQPGLHPAS